MATSEPGQKEQETDLKPPSSSSVLWGQAVTSLSHSGVIEGVKKIPQESHNAPFLLEYCLPCSLGFCFCLC